METGINELVFQGEDSKARLKEINFESIKVGSSTFVSQNWIRRFDISAFISDVNKRNQDIKFKCTYDEVLQEKGVRVWRIK
jgi:hypothetical protein